LCFDIMMLNEGRASPASLYGDVRISLDTKWTR
jgi:hypothetical protein